MSLIRAFLDLILLLEEGAPRSSVCLNLSFVHGPLEVFLSLSIVSAIHLYSNYY